MHVIHDHSKLATDVLQQLEKLDFEFVNAGYSEAVARKGLLSSEVTIFIYAAQSQLAPALRKLFQQAREDDFEADINDCLIITDDARQLGRWNDDRRKFFIDVVLWPEPIGILKNRIQSLEHANSLRAELTQTRHSLAWHATRIDREHQLVEHIFRNALSRNYLEYQHIRTYLTPVSKFNGDLCLVAPGPIGNIYVFMADFTGHGLAPATGALPLSQAFFAMADRGVSVAEMVTEFNFRLNRLLPDDMFCAGILLELSANGERVTFWNGGMPPAVLFSDAGEILDRMPAQHMALGVLDDDDFDSRVTTFRAPAKSNIALYTDGVIELLGHKMEFLGSDTLEQMLRRFSAPADFPKLVGELEHFRGTQPLHDDLSLAVLSCCPTGLDELKQPHDDMAMPFTLTIDLTSNQLREMDPVNHVLNAIGTLPRLRNHRTTIYLLLAEAYNNALEHGLLRLDSSIKQAPEGFMNYYQLRAERLQALDEGKIRIHVNFIAENDIVEFTVTDTGSGWDTERVIASSHMNHGRGLDLLRQLTTQLKWEQNGREVYFSYQL